MRIMEDFMVFFSLIVKRMLIIEANRTRMLLLTTVKSWVACYNEYHFFPFVLYFFPSVRKRRKKKWDFQIFPNRKFAKFSIEGTNSFTYPRIYVCLFVFFPSLYPHFFLLTRHVRQHLQNKEKKCERL